MQFINLKEVMDMTGLGRTTIYVKMARGEFPKSVSTGERRVVWVFDEVLDWQKSRIALRDTRAAARDVAA